jgi:hypothetical protein
MKGLRALLDHPVGDDLLARSLTQVLAGRTASRSAYLRTRGDRLKVGDVVQVWWSRVGQTITHIEPYTGPHASLPHWADARLCQVGQGDETASLIVFARELYERRRRKPA